MPKIRVINKNKLNSFKDIEYEFGDETLHSFIKKIETLKKRIERTLDLYLQNVSLKIGSSGRSHSSSRIKTKRWWNFVY